MNFCVRFLFDIKTESLEEFAKGEHSEIRGAAEFANNLHVIIFLDDSALQKEFIETSDTRSCQSHSC